ncbi:MAG TPA: hypothetical protein VGD53_08000 [Actinoallomurus sp.]
MSSGSERSGRFVRSVCFELRPFLALGLAAIVVAGLAGCASGTTAGAVAKDPSSKKTEGSPQHWCADMDWLSPAAGLYESAYRHAPRPITPKAIDADLASGGLLEVGYRRLAGMGSMPANVNAHDLRDFLVSIAAAEAAGTDPAKYAKVLVATCES